MDIIFVFYYTFSIYPLILIVFGTIGNTLSFAILIQKSLRSTSTFTFAAFICIADIFTLYVWNLDHYLQTFNNDINIEFLSVPLCKIATFIQFTSLQYSSWLLVSLSAERYLSIRVKAWKTKYFNSNKAVLVSIGIGVFICLLNGHLLIANGYIEQANGTEIVHCYRSEHHAIFPFWQTVHLLTYNFIPTAFLSVFNTLLIRHILIQKAKINTTVSFRLQLSQNIQKSINRTVIIMTVLFFVLSLPASLVSLCLSSTLPSTIIAQLIFSVCDGITFTYHSSNFIILFFSNKQFKRQFLSFFCKKKFERSSNNSNRL